ncbi:TATA element modulatory factor 1 [Linnemannia zychae]|nr:TATA element modulatory factor 1 [Linnemannia zychae]
MSSFFGTSSSGSGSNANGSSSNSGSGGGGTGGGGWGSFLKQGLSQIESKLDMVLDIQVPIPGAAAGALTSLSPHANVLPSNITGSSTTKDTPPKRQASPLAPLAAQGEGRNSQDVNIKSSSQDLRRSVVGSKVVQDDINRRNSSQNEEASVTVDPFTGMVTTAPGIKRMSTPPVSTGLSASAAAAAAAAAANRERLEQRMRGIFKKPVESPPTTPPTSKGASPSPSPSTRISVSTEPEDKDDDSEGPKDKVIVAEAEKSVQEDDAAEPSESQEDKSEREPKVLLSETQVSTKDLDPKESVNKDKDVDKGTLKEGTDDVVSEKDRFEESSDAVELKDDAKAEPATEVPAKTSSDEAAKVPETEPIVEAVAEDSHPAEEAKISAAPSQGQAEEVDSIEIPEVGVPSMPTDQSSTRTSPEHDVVVNSLSDRPDTPLSTAESDTGVVETVKAEPTTILTSTRDATQPESTSKDASSSGDTNPLKRILDQREEQLFKVMQEQSILIERLRDLEDAKAAEDARNAVKLAGLEKMIETQKRELEVARGSNLATQPKSIQKTLEEQRGLLEEKDEQIRGLLAEGEVLSKKEFKHMTTIKALRMKTIEMEKGQMDAQKKMDKVVADLTEAQGKVARLTDENKQLQESVKSLHDINQRQNKQMTKLESELAQLRDDKVGLQMGLDRAWQELTEARKASAELSSQTHAAALEREMKMNEDLQENLDSLKAQHAAVESNLRQDIQELRVSLSNREELAGEKEDQLYMEIRSLQARLEQSDHDSYELQETLDEARRPLLHQIEILQNQQGVAHRNWDKVEKSLTRRITEAEESAVKAQERERNARDKLDEVKSQIITLEARLETLRIADTQLRSEMNTSKRALAEKEEAARQAQSELSRERLNRERAVEEAKEDVERKWRQQQQAEVEKLKAQIQQLQQQQSQRPIHSGSEGDLLHTSSNSINARRPSSSSVVSVNSPMLGGGGASASKIVGGGYQVRTSFESMTSPTSLDGMAPSLSRSSSSHTMTGVVAGAGPGTPTVGLVGLGGGGGSNAGQAVAIERLNTMVRQLEGQVTFLAEQVRSANRNKDELSDELVRVTMELEELQGAAVKVPSLEQELTLLKDRHRAALEMLGEKTEEVQELRADIVDVKEAYRDQINDLLSQLEKLRRTNAN